MVIRYEDILTLVTTIGDQEGLKVTVTQSLKGGAIAGTACALGGLIAGPPGLALGGAIGGCLAAYATQGKFKALSDVVREDIDEQSKQLLVATIQDIIGTLEASDGLELIALVQGNELLKARIVSELITFFGNTLRMHVVGNSTPLSS